jgi:hypothetical protein
MSDNKLLPEACQHVARGELKHLHTLELSTTGLADADYRYGTGPDRMRLCPFCTGLLLALLRGREVHGLCDPLVPGSERAR